MIERVFISQWKGLLAGSLLLLLSMPAQGQLIRVQSLLSRDSMMIGEQINYTLHVDAAADVEFSLPLIRDTLSDDLEVVSWLGSDTTNSGDRTGVEQLYRITGFESGSHIVPAQEVIYRRGNVLDTARSMPLILDLYDPVVDTSQQIKAIKPPINRPLSFGEVFPWAAAGL